MTNEIRELRAHSAGLGKRTEELQQSSAAERTRTANIVAQLANLQAPRNKPRRNERTTIATQEVRHSPEINNDREKITSSKPTLDGVSAEAPN